MKLSPLKPPFSSSLENMPISIESRRDRRRREKRHAEPSGPSSPTQQLPQDEVGGSKPVMTRTFEEGDDFIPFGFSEGSDEEHDAISSVRRHSPSANGRDKGKGKGKEREISPPSENRGKERMRARSRSPPRVKDKDRDHNEHRERNGDQVKDRDRGRDKDEDKVRERDRGRERDRPREWERDAHGDRDGDMDRGRGRGAEKDRNRTKSSYERYDSMDGYTNKKQRTDAVSRKSPWVAGLDWDRCRHVAEMLHTEVEAFVNWISPSPVEDEVRGLIVSLISKAVTLAFPDASVHPFGSYQTKLYLPLGDIDLVIISQSMAYSDKVTGLHALANTLKRAGITSKVTIIAKAKVPIVKFITTHGRFNVDISINQENGIVSGNIINGFLRDMHGSGTGGKGSMALRSLVMITKAFLSQRSMNEVFTGGLGSYSIVCLAISFLQMHPKIRRGEIDAEKNLGVLVMEFFELYGCYFNYEEVGISVRDGGTYFSKKQRGWHDYYKGNLLSIEDPTDPSNDISRGSYGFQKVRATFAGAHGILTATAYLHAGIIASRRQGRSVHLRNRKEPDDMSILASVMGVTQETINHRKLVQEVYDKRVLHNLLGIKPQPAVIDSAHTRKSGEVQPGASSLASRGAKSVESAWQEAERELDDHHKRHRGYDDEEEEGRYHINRQQPPRKRQKTGGQHDAHAVFTTDDDGDDLLSMLGDDLDSLKEEAHYSRSEIGPSRSKEDSEKTEQRRSYWLSKGIGIEEVSSR